MYDGREIGEQWVGRTTFDFEAATYEDGQAAARTHSEPHSLFQRMFGDDLIQRSGLSPRTVAHDMGISVRHQNQVACRYAELTVLAFNLEQTSAPGDGVKCCDGLPVHAESPGRPKIRPAVDSSSYVKMV